jgi:hypothetical protein
LVLVTEVAVKEERRGQAEHRHHQRRQANPVARQQHQAAAHFDRHRDDERERCHRQTNCRDLANRPGVGTQLAQPAHEKRHAKKNF